MFQWSSLAMFTQVTDYRLGGDCNFNLLWVLGMSNKVPGVHDYEPPMIGVPSESLMEYWFGMQYHAIVFY